MLPHFKFGNKAICTYCGDPAESIDHVIPKSYQSERRLTRQMLYGPITWACKQCNSKLGNRYFSDFRVRCELVRDFYERKAKAVHWSEAQLLEISEPLRSWLRNKRNERLWYRYKADWQGSRDFLLNIESLTWIPVLKLGAPEFHRELYNYFWPTLQSLKQLEEVYK